MDSRNPAPAAAGVFESGPLRGKEFTFRRPAAAPEPASAAGAAPPNASSSPTSSGSWRRSRWSPPRASSAQRISSSTEREVHRSPSTGKIHKVSKVSGQNPTCPALRVRTARVPRL
eukprot:tig00000113_g5685.t1